MPPPGNPYRLPLRLLLSGYYPFVLLLAGGAAVLAAWLLGYGFRGQPGGLVVGVFGAACLFAAGQVVWGLRALRTPEQEPDPFEFDLPDAWQPGLLKLIRTVALRHDLPLPDAVRVHAVSTAHVYEDGRGRKVLAVGGLAVGAFSQTALAGVVAHELAHFAADDTGLSARGLRRHRLMGQLEIDHLARPANVWNPLAWLLRGYHRLYAVVWAANSRRQEYAADAREVEHVGKKEAAATLVRLEVLANLPWTRPAAVAEWFVAGNLPLDALYAEQVRRLKTLHAVDWENGLKRGLRDGGELLDTHPCLKDRLAALGVKPKAALAAAMDLSGEPATALFPHWPVVEKFLTKKLVDIVRANHLERRAAAEDLRLILRGGR